MSIDKLQQIHAATHPAKLTHADQVQALLSALAAEAQADGEA